MNSVMPTTRLFIECPNCHQRYLIKKGLFTYCDGGYIEKVAGAPEWQRLLCPCRPNEPYKFRLEEKTRLQVLSDEDSEQTHFRPKKSEGG